MAVCAAASACALVASSCGGDDVVSRCIERFNSSANLMRDFVSDYGDRAPVWLGESKVRPEKCVAVVGLGGEGAFVVLRENFNEGAEPGSWNALSTATTEGTPQELGARVRDPVAVGKPDGTIEAK